MDAISLFSWMSVGCFILFIYPYLIYPVLLRFFSKHEYLPPESINAEGISVALVFCAYNEAPALPEKIANIRALKKLHPGIQVYAYSDCSDDGTNELLIQADDVLTPVIGKERAGKVLGMQKLVSMTAADVIIFTDANVIMALDSVTKLLEYFADKTIGSVGGTLHYISSETCDDTATAEVGGLYWRLEEHIKKLESATGSTMGADGAIFARRRNGYPELPGQLVDDMAASISVIFDGMRCVSAPNVIAYEVSVGASSEEFRRKRRIACGSYATYKYLLPQLRKMSLLNRFKYFSHKTLRWWGALCLALGVLFMLVAAWLAGFFVWTFSVVAFCAALILLLGSKGVSLFATVYEILSAIIATGFGVVEYFIGHKYQVWSPAKSR